MRGEQTEADESQAMRKLFDSAGTQEQPAVIPDDEEEQPADDIDDLSGCVHHIFFTRSKTRARDLRQPHSDHLAQGEDAECL
jgi:hypothetical protein